MSGGTGGTSGVGSGQGDDLVGQLRDIAAEFQKTQLEANIENQKIRLTNATKPTG